MKGITVRKYTTLAVCATALLTLVPRPAHASWWEVTYTAVGQYTGDGWNGNGAPWTLHPVPYDGTGWVDVGLPYPSYMDGGAVGSVSATLTWIPKTGENLLTDPPPPKVSFFESVSVGAEMMFSDLPTNSFNTTAYNGFGDPVVTTASGGAFCSGHHFFSLDVDGSTGVVHVPPVVLFVSAHAVDRNTWCVVTSDARIKIDFVGMSLHCESTDGVVNTQSGEAPFFSGTNCLASGSITLPADSKGIDSACLKVGNEVLSAFSRLSDSPGMPAPIGLTLNAHFDSTHFAHNTPLVVSFTVNDKEGNSFSKVETVSAYNQALVLGGNPDIFRWNAGTNCSQIAAEHFEWVNYQQPVTAHTDWYKCQILDGITGASGFFVANHGDSDPPKFKACLGKTDEFQDPDYEQYGDWVNCYDLEGEVLQKFSANCWTAPPYNVVVLAACATLELKTGPELSRTVVPGGVDEKMASNGFHIFSTSVDRACIGFNTNQYVLSLEGWTRFLFGPLANGCTALKAAILAQDSQREEIEGLLDNYSILGFPWVSDVTKVLGDPGTKLHGVYRGKGTTWRLADEPVVLYPSDS